MTTVLPTPPAALQVRLIEHISDLDVLDWNALGTMPYPFLRHEFLAALEAHGCLGERFGWLPRHLTLWEGDRLLAAAPLYLKFNSYGEFVFDWAWADAYQRHGLAYYPKLVSASPYTPATGPKLLLHPEAPTGSRTMIGEAALQLARQLGVSSLHWLFTTDNDEQALHKLGHLCRQGCQFHWQNRGYRDFDDFLATLSSAKRKNIRKERRKVTDSGIGFRLLDGRTAKVEDWETFHALYESTFERHSGIPTLSLDFFLGIADRMPEAVLLIMADQGPKCVAAAFCLVGTDTLYGRHWGCSTYVDNLHFETCYYQGLEYCISRGLQRFEPGAQGEHKIARGFLPTATHSMHWLADRSFMEAVARHLQYESAGMRDYIQEMHGRSPYRVTKPQ